MSLASQASGITNTLLLASQSAANTAAATSAWTQVTNAEGEVEIVINVGTITGTITFTFETATDGSGTGSAAITPLDGALAQVTTANDVAVYRARFDARRLAGYIRCVGTIVTGPALVGYVLRHRPKTV